MFELPTIFIYVVYTLADKQNQQQHNSFDIKLYIFIIENWNLKCNRLV